MDYLFGDFETYFDRAYSLSRLTTEAYVRDPRFEAICFCGYHPLTGRTFKAIGRDSIRATIDGINWKDTHFVSHHAHFDGLILSHHYGVHPALMGCTLSMARSQGRDKTGARLGLGALAEHLGLAPKTVDYDMFRGKRPEHLTPVQLEALAEQCLDDCLIGYDVFSYLMQECEFPEDELIVIDQTIKMFTSPLLVGNVEHFRAISSQEAARKAELLKAAGATREQLMSANGCKELLEELGIEVAMKAGKEKKDKEGNVIKTEIPALAKTDDFMKELLEHPNEQVQAVAEARLNIKSTIVETRAQRFADIASRGAIPIYLNYCAAHTTRWGGGDKQNSQNFKRKGPLREGITSPDGTSLVIIDFSQVEARILLRLAGQLDQLEYFASGKDAYVAMAARLYGISEAQVTRMQRGMGKQIVLACGFGAGGLTIQRTAKSGQYTDGVPLIIGIEVAEAAKKLYREINYKVNALWAWGKAILHYMLVGEQADKNYSRTMEEFFIPVHREGKKLLLPNGLYLDYSTIDATYSETKVGTAKYNRFIQGLLVQARKELSELVDPTARLAKETFICALERCETVDLDFSRFPYDVNGKIVYIHEIFCKHRHEVVKLYGGKLIENIVQALERVMISDAIVRIRKCRALDSVRIVMTAHDELVFVCRDEELDTAVPLLKTIMTTEPKWLKGLPVDVEVKVSKNYGK